MNGNMTDFLKLLTGYRNTGRSWIRENDHISSEHLN